MKNIAQTGNYTYFARTNLSMLKSLLYIELELSDFRLGILAFITAFVISMVLMPPLIKAIHHFKLFDVPDNRKEHFEPVPTMGGIASCIGLAVGLLIWFPYSGDTFTISFFFSIYICRSPAFLSIFTFDSIFIFLSFNNLAFKAAIYC